MSKRSFGEYAACNTGSLSQALEHADDLLRAAQALKQDLQDLCRDPEPDIKVSEVLRNHKDKILPATQALIQNEPGSQQENGSRKSQKPGGSHQAIDGLPSAISVPTPASLTRWTLEDISGSSLPPLVQVQNPVLEQAALTHVGMTTSAGMNYEQLEWIGDAYIYLMSSAYIYQTFPHLPTGRCSQLRERIVKNETLSEYTVQYGIDKRMTCPSEFTESGRIGGNKATGKARRKLLGDVFEAYVAAAILGDPTGLSRVATWLKSLWSITLREDIRKEYARGPASAQARTSLDSIGSKPTPTQQELNPKTILVQTVGTKGVRISYNDVGEPQKEKNSGLPWYTVVAVYDGLGESNLHLGFGSGMSKKEAGAKAASIALGNKKLIKRLQKKKDDIRAAEASAHLDYGN